MSVTLQTSYGKTTRDGRKILVVDTPGLLDNRKDVFVEDTIQEMLKCISVTSPGIHSLILVLGMERFTEENAKVFEVIMQLFGSELKKYLIVVFTNKDKMQRSDKSLKEYIQESPPELQNIINNYCRDYMAIDNTKPYETNEDASLLIQKINEIVESNGGQFYTSESYKIAEEFFRDDVRKLNSDGSLKKRINDHQRNEKVFSKPLPSLYKESYGFEGREISYTSYSGEGASYSINRSSYSSMGTSYSCGGISNNGMETPYPGGGTSYSGMEARYSGMGNTFPGVGTSNPSFSNIQQPFQNLTHNDRKSHVNEKNAKIDHEPIFDQGGNILGNNSSILPNPILIGDRNKEDTSTRMPGSFRETFIADQERLEKELKERNQAAAKNYNNPVLEDTNEPDIVQANVDYRQQQVEINEDLLENENVRDVQRQRVLRNEDDVIRGFWGKMKDRINRFIEAIKGIFKRN